MAAKIPKLELAEQLTKKPTSQEEVEKYNENIHKGIKIYNRLCLSTSLRPNDKVTVIGSFIKAVPDEGKDMLMRWRDMIPYLRDRDLEDMIDLMIKITRSPSINSHERVATATTLYNNGFIDCCYDCFADLACDRSVLVDYRVESARYLFATEDEELQQIAQEALLEVVDTNDYPSEYRYRVISGFISKTGVSTMMNMKKLKVPYNEEFVYGLQINFFNCEDGINGIRERILSGQHLLQMVCTDDDEKIEIGETLLSFVANKEFDENTRADAADVVMRLGVGDQKKRAHISMVDLGRSRVGATSTGSLMDNANTIYNDSQNIHGFTEQIDRFIEKIINDTKINIRSYPEIHQEVAELVRKNVKTPEDRFKALKALNRISVDTATFTKYKVNLAEIFIHVWLRAQQNFEDDVTIELQNRMVDELVDMGETCSTGHAGRFVNVLSHYDDTLKISWGEQIAANLAGRLNARIRDCKDNDLRIKLAIATSEKAEKEDKEAYLKFIEEQLAELREELSKEFVGQGYVKDADFQKAFDAGCVNFV